MSRFEDRAIEIQANCVTIGEANKQMEISCNICCMRRNVPCKNCKVQIAHEQVVAAIIDNKIINERKEKAGET